VGQVSIVGETKRECACHAVTTKGPGTGYQTSLQEALVQESKEIIGERTQAKGETRRNGVGGKAGKEKIYKRTKVERVN